MKTYGITNSNQIFDKIDYHIENIRIKGYSIENNVIDEETCSFYTNKLEEIYSKQEEEFGRENLEIINELDTVRMPFIYDKRFTKFFMHDLVLELTTQIIGENFQLHLQNAVINRPQKEHHQTSWHRDLPYQDWTISKPLAFNAFFCLSDFNLLNGATFVLPFSHNIDFFPSEKYVEENEKQLIAKRGSVIFFNSMIYHRAGNNVSNETRYGLNNMFVSPFIKQQIILSHCIDEKEFSADEIRVIGSRFDVPSNINQFRMNKIKKKRS
jgi:ectoine hydroxylase-related dioxygenase (phytanoyl-CoA dioxygenase family)